jgi:phosphomannomutase
MRGFHALILLTAFDPAIAFMVHPDSQPFVINPIKFGTDGWRGIIAADFTFERLLRVAPLAALVLAEAYRDPTLGRRMIIGYDRRFLSPEFAQATATAVAAAGFDVFLSSDYAPTPAFSWAVKQHQALGALVITASHNPGIYSGLKVKGAFGGSVPPEITQQIEARLHSPIPLAATPGRLTRFDPWPDYCRVLGSKVNLAQIRQAMATGKLQVIVDVMHGAAAGGLARILEQPIQELNRNSDPMFGGGAPEPIARYLQTTCEILRQTAATAVKNTLTLGLVFDGDGDRIAAVDAKGTFQSAQVLIPILINHLATRRGFTGEVIKSISSSDLIPRVAAARNLPLYETPIGFKYTADRMLESPQVLLGGEESGGIGFGNHIPERDALLSGLYLLEAAVTTGQDLSQLYQTLQQETGFTSYYDRIDLPLANAASKDRLQHQLETSPPQLILDSPVLNCLTIDGFKFQLANQSWLLIRFSGTEPLLRLYCEASTPEQVQHTLNWAKQWALREGS